MCRVQEWQLSLSCFLSYFPLIVSDAISCPLHNLNTLWYITMIPYSYVQEWQLSLSYFLSYFPYIVSDAISWPLHNLKILWYIIIILYSYVEQILMMCCVQECQLSLSYFLSYFPLNVSDAILYPLHNFKTIWYIIMILYSYVEHILVMCRLQK